MINAIYVFDKAVAEKIASHGFSYIEEKIGEKSVYRFISCLGLDFLLNNEFSEKDFFKKKYVNFENGGIRSGKVCEV